MNTTIKKIYSVLTICFTVLIAQGQTNTCSGSYTSTANSCQAMVIGDGSPGYIEICLDNNNIPSGGGTSCNPGGACNPPYNGGGHAPRIAIYNSDGTSYTGIALSNFLGTTANGTCVTIPSSNGYAYIFGLCLTAGTTISWTTLNSCGDEICTGTAPPCSGPPCGSCSDACGTCGFETPPTIAEVTASCDSYPYLPSLGPGQTSTRCHQFTAVNTDVDFNVIITSDCGAGNVTNFTWELQSSTCAGILQTGLISDLTFNGLTVGETYTFCYTFTVPATCSHSAHSPYFVGAETVVLPVNLLSFTGVSRKDMNEIMWSTTSEENNDYFIIEHSKNGEIWTEIDRVNGAGNSTSLNDYYLFHRDFENTINYYKLKQVDYDGSITNHGIISIDNRTEIMILQRVNTLGQEVDETYKGIVFEYYSDGSTRKIMQ